MTNDLERAAGELAATLVSVTGCRRSEAGQTILQVKLASCLLVANRIRLHTEGMLADKLSSGSVRFVATPLAVPSA